MLAGLRRRPRPSRSGCPSSSTSPSRRTSSNLTPDEVPVPEAITPRRSSLRSRSRRSWTTPTTGRPRDAYLDPPGNPYAGKHLSIIKGDEDDDDSQMIMGPYRFKFDPPQVGYEMRRRARRRRPGQQERDRGSSRPRPRTARFDLIMQRVNFGGETVINLDVELVFLRRRPPRRPTRRARAAAAKYEVEKSDAAGGASWRPCESGSRTRAASAPAVLGSARGGADRRLSQADRAAHAGQLEAAGHGRNPAAQPPAL